MKTTQAHLEHVARKTGLTVAQIRAANPELNQPNGAPSPIPAERIANGARIRIDPGSNEFGAVEGRISFAGDTLLSGASVTVTPGYANADGPLSGQLLFTGFDHNSADQQQHEIVTGDTVLLKNRNSASGVITLAGSSSTSSKAAAWLKKRARFYRVQAGSTMSARGLASLLLPEELAVAKQMRIDPDDMAATIAESSPDLFARRCASVGVDASALAPEGIKSGSKVSLAPGNEARGPAKGTLSFQASPDGFLRDGDHVVLEPGDSAGRVSGTITYLGDMPDPSDGEKRIIQDGDECLIGETIASGSSGVLTVLGSSPSKAVAKAIVGKAWLAQERQSIRSKQIARLDADRAKLRAQLKALREGKTA